MVKENKHKVAGENNGQRRRPQKDWTVMVYMVAGDNAELDDVAVQDIREMERGVGLNPNDNLNVVVQINRAWPDAAQRYEIRKASTDSSKDDFHRGRSILLGPVGKRDTNMADRKTLTDFVTTTVTNKHYRAERYFLVLWGHAYGLGFGRDHNDKLTLAELKAALNAFRRARAKKPGHPRPKLELLGTNACAMSYVEALYELRNAAEFMVTSQIAVPLAGFPYESILQRIGKVLGAKDLGDLVVDSYVSHFNALPGGSRVALTLLKLAEAKQLAPIVKDLAATIDSNLFPERAAHIRDAFLATATGDVRPLIDLKELVSILSETLSPGLDTLKAKLEKELLPQLVVKHLGHPTLETALNGVGIYAPFVTDEDDLRRLELAGNRNGQPSTDGKRTGRREYEHLELFRESAAGQSWPSLVYDRLGGEIPSALRASIQSIGVMNQGERADIAQIMMAIESSFNMLDRLAKDARARIVKELKGEKSTNQGTTGSTVMSAGNGTTPTVGNSKKAGKKASAVAVNGKPAAESVPPPTSPKSERHFREPWLRLTAPQNGKSSDLAAAMVAYVQNQINGSNTIQAQGTASGSGTANGEGTTTPANGDLTTVVVEQLRLVEDAVERVEKATRTGLTHAKFGIGPSGTTQVTSFFDPKDDHGAPTNGGSFEDPKDDHGVRNNGASFALPGGDLRGDLALARVRELFGQVGTSLRELEDAMADLEVTAHSTFADSSQQPALGQQDYVEAAIQRLSRAFRIVEEGSLKARRTVRHVLTHPVYGLGPESGSGFGLDEREELARSGGLNGRNLRLL